MADTVLLTGSGGRLLKADGGTLVLERVVVPIVRPARVVNVANPVARRVTRFISGDPRR